MIAQRAKYSQFELSARNWQSQHVRGYVMALSRQLTVAHMAGWQRTIGDITALLGHYEPLHETRECEYAGNVLWIAYNWYCARDIDSTRAAIAYALRRWTDDEGLVRMMEVVSASKVPSH